MSDLIRREDVVAVLCFSKETGQMVCGDLRKLLEEIKAIPSAEPELTKGEWVRNFNGNEWYWYCSNCKKEWYEEDLWMGGNDFPSFCPNCGADMRGD